MQLPPLGINQTEGFYAVTKIQVLKSLDLKRRYYRKMDGRLLLMRTCLDISIPKDQNTGNLYQKWKTTSSQF
jgi:hypothetical protein